jgi:peptidoglycan hydrolase-like protein with peptidoglycan-binding domain
MSTYELRARRATPRPRRDREARLTIAVVAATVLALGAVGLLAATRQPGGGGGGIASLQGVPASVAPAPTVAASSPPATSVAPAGAATADPAAAVQAAKSTDGDLVEATTADCTITATKLAMGDSGADVSCLQQGLITAGYTTVTQNGQFDQATYEAVRTMQTERDLFVDGIVGRESAISLNVWPDEQSFVVHTPAPAPGATDSLGFPLSSVSSTGADAPPLPADSGSGRRVVYDRRGQRVWAIGDDGQVIRSYLVSGSKYGNEQPGVHKVYSRSEMSTAWNGRAYLPLMVRYQKTAIGAIGFHAIPIHRSDGTVYMTEAELGTRLSGGCQRQANADAQFMWAFAQVGTPVVVV